MPWRPQYLPSPIKVQTLTICYNIINFSYYLEIIGHINKINCILKSYSTKIEFECDFSPMQNISCGNLQLLKFSIIAWCIVPDCFFSRCCLFPLVDVRLRLYCELLLRIMIRDYYACTGCFLLVFMK